MDPSSALDDSLGIIDDDSLGVLEEDEYFQISPFAPKVRQKSLGSEFLGALNYPQFGIKAGVEEDPWRGLDAPDDELMNLGGDYLEDIELPSFDSLPGDSSLLGPQSPQVYQRDQAPRSPGSPQSIAEPLAPMPRPPPESYHFFGLLEPEQPLKKRKRGVRDTNDLIDLEQIIEDIPREHTQDERPAWYEFLRSEILNIFHKYQVDVNYHDFISPQALMSALRYYIDDLHVQLQKYASISQVPEIAASLSPEQELTQFESPPSGRPTSAVGEVVEQLQSNLNELREENLQLHDLSFDLEAELAYAESKLSQMDKETSGLERIDLKEQFMEDLEARNAAASQLNSSLHSDLDRERSKVSRLMAALNEARRRIADLGEKEMTYVSLIESLPEGDLNERITEKMARMAEAYIGSTRPPNAFDAESVRDEWARLMRDAISEVEQEYKELVLEKIQQEEMVRDKMEMVRQLKLQEADVDNQIRNLKHAIALKKEDIEKQKNVAADISPEKGAIQEPIKELKQSPPKKVPPQKSPVSKQMPSTSRAIRTSGQMIRPQPPMIRQPQKESKKISPERTPIQAAAQIPETTATSKSPRQVSPRPGTVREEPKTTSLQVPGRIPPVSKQIPETPRTTRATAQIAPQSFVAEPQQMRETERRLPERTAIPGPSSSRKIPEAPRSIKTFGLPRPMQFQKKPPDSESISKTVQLTSPRRPTPLNANINVKPQPTGKADTISYNIALTAAEGKSKPTLRRELKPPGSRAGPPNRRLSIPKKL